MSLRTILVSGASRGIGLEVTTLLLRKFNVNVVALSRTRTPELSALACDSLLILEGDVTNEEIVKNAVAQAAQTFGSLDSLILNAGIVDPLSRIADDKTSLDQWKMHFDVNFFSLVTALKFAVPHLRASTHGGRVVFVSSGAAVKGTAGWGPYNASKAAMNSLARTLAEEEPDIVSVALRPGMVATGMQATLREVGGSAMNPKDHQMFVSAHAEGKLLSPEVPGHVIASLALTAAKSLSGQFIFLTMNRSPRIDIHHHFFPSDLDKGVAAGQKVGWRTPSENLPWSPDVSLRYMNARSIDCAILSFPAISSGTIGQANRDEARQRNRAMADIRLHHPGRFGFFATLPYLYDIQGTLDEIAYAMDELKADGVALPSACGIGDDAKYIGHELFEPILHELNRRSAVVFLHGAQTPSSTPSPDISLGIPITEVPGETFKAAAHLVVTGRRRKFRDMSVILAHMGGSAPWLAPRVAAMSGYMGCALSPEDIMEDFQSFYFDTALSSHESTLEFMSSFTSQDRIVFGTDFPAGTPIISSDSC
ncbi:unnamed protein product [Mycena citricolor]|uniref:Ketoreductase domain-containing protein n=1 Tax=Mycena citricolor TaxID=2018698 RepID=A0AAD2HHV4_9AGAR|nr:unnamed protein product [Mycena citricolor]